MEITLDSINKMIQDNKDTLPAGKISDGYHTFDELYAHRIVLFVTLCNLLYKTSGWAMTWKSKKHHDGTSMEGWFIAGIFEENGQQISYHLPLGVWDKLRAVERKTAPVWDGHTSDDVAERLLNLAKSYD